MKFFKPKTDAIEYIRVEPSFSKTSSNINNAKSGSDTNSQPGFILRSQIEEMIKNHRPKTEKEIKAESEGLIRLCSMAFIFLIVLSGNDSNLLIVFYVQIMPDDFVMQLHR
ncbi:hypothetical protein MQC27_24855, partial [Escherichia coli]|nr:hypothetical protein [Escherichia coli]